MALIDWGPQLELGFAVIDEQHRQLVTLINRLHAINVGERELTEMDAIFAELVVYTRTHFVTEEELMRRHGYAQCAAHQSEHRKFIKVLSEFRTKYEGGHVTISIAVMTFLREWLSNHILESDKQLVRGLNALGVH